MNHVIASAQPATGGFDVLQDVERELLQPIGAVSVRWYGRAATALYRAYQTAQAVGAKIDVPEIIFPAMMCSTPANVAILAGMQPRFADVDPRTGMPTLQTLQQRCTPATRAVVFVHLFGQTADLSAVAAWCRSRGILLIEDIAQALGAKLPDGRPAGSLGDFSVYSFNPTKILQCGGGALVVRDRQLLAVLDQVCAASPLPPEPAPEVAALLALSYRNLHHAVVALLRLHRTSEVASWFVRMHPAYDELYRRSLADPRALALAWPRTPELLALRRRHAAVYSEQLQGGPWQLLDGWRYSGVCWRYGLLVDFPEHLAAFSEAVRRDGFHVSNLYWPVHPFFRPQDDCPNAEAFARRVVNLWVDESVDAAWVSGCCQSIRRHAAQFAGGPQEAGSG